MNQNKIEELQFMFEAQTKIVCSLEIEKIEMQKKIDLLQEENNTLQGYLNNIQHNIKNMIEVNNA